MTEQTAKQKVFEIAKSEGAEISTSSKTVYIDLPQGKAWRADCGYSHCLHVHLEEKAAWQDALERVTLGVQTCINEECDCCHPYING